MKKKYSKKRVIIQGFKADCFSLCANALGKGINPSVLTLAMSE